MLEVELYWLAGFAGAKLRYYHRGGEDRGTDRRWWFKQWDKEGRTCCSVDVEDWSPSTNPVHFKLVLAEIVKRKDWFWLIREMDSELDHENKNNTEWVMDFVCRTALKLW